MTRCHRLLAITAVLLFTLLLSAVGYGWAEDNSGDFTRRLTGGQHLRIVTYGTSLTTPGFSYWVGEFKKILETRYPDLTTVTNSAQSAMWSGWGVDNLDQRVIKKNPDVVFIEFGMNDANVTLKTSLEDCRRNVENMVSRIKQANPSCDIILMTMDYPIREHLKIRPDIEKYYQVYRDIAKENNLKLIDLFPVWKKIYDTDPNLYSYYVPDGIHPGKSGTQFVIMPGIISAFAGLRDLAADMLRPSEYRDSGTVKAVLGEKDEYYGIKRTYNVTDSTIWETVGGEQGRKNGDTNPSMYFDVEDGWIRSLSTDATVIVRYFDSGSGWFRIDYDSTDSTAPSSGASKSSIKVSLSDSGSWKNATIPLKGVRFDGRQVANADLRLFFSPGTEPVIGSIELVKNSVTK